MADPHRCLHHHELLSPHSLPPHFDHNNNMDFLPSLIHYHRGQFASDCACLLFLHIHTALLLTHSLIHIRFYITVFLFGSLGCTCSVRDRMLYSVIITYMGLVPTSCQMTRHRECSTSRDRASPHIIPSSSSSSACPTPNPSSQSPSPVPQVGLTLHSLNLC